MDATFLNILRGLEWDTLTISQASEVMGALREAVEKGELWYRKFSAGFVNGKAQTHHSENPGRPRTETGQFAPAVPRHAAASTQKAAPVKRGRGRPRKAITPEVMDEIGAQAEREHRGKPTVTVNDHPPIGVLTGSYVSTTGPDLNRSYSLPPTHPRATGVAPATTGDADFAAVEAGKVRFQ